MRRTVPVFLFTAVAAALILTGCSGTPDEAPKAPSMASYIDGVQDARELIDTLDALPLDERPVGEIASVQPDQVVISANGRGDITLPLPEDEFYLSVAPYAQQTHECFFHSLTTCVGELGGATFHVTVIDDATGDVILDEERTAYANGFVGLWLPRGITGTLTVSDGDRSASTPISTGESDPTCLTTLQLT